LEGAETVCSTTTVASIVALSTEEGFCSGTGDVCVAVAGWGVESCVSAGEDGLRLQAGVAMMKMNRLMKRAFDICKLTSTTGLFEDKR
jgi:hypothetical protein